MGPDSFQWGLHDLKYMGKDGTNLVPKEKGWRRTGSISRLRKEFGKLVVRMKKSPNNWLAKYHPDSTRLQSTVCGRFRKVQRSGSTGHEKAMFPLWIFSLRVKNMKDWMKRQMFTTYPHGSQALARLVANDILKRLKK